jgi:hypothetical protein
MNKSKRMRKAGHAAHMWEIRKGYNILVRKPDEKGPLKKQRHRWEDNIKIDLREIGFGV